MKPPASFILGLIALALAAVPLTTVFKSGKVISASLPNPVVVTTPDGKQWILEHLFGDRCSLKPLVTETPK